MTKILFVPALIALAATAGCSRSTDTAVTSPAERVRGQSVELAESGITTGQRGLHHSNVIAFGTPRDQVLAQLRGVLDPQTAAGTNDDCPTGSVDYVMFNDLRLHFDRTGFVGYIVDGSNPDVQTYQGLKVGTLRSEIDGDAEVVEQDNGTLGPELSVNGVGALFDRAGPMGRVTTVFSGITCFAR